MAGNVKELFRRIRNYFRTHIMLRVICVMLSVLVLIMMIFQSFLQNQYYKYLVRQIQETENTVLSSTANVLNNALATSLRIAGEVAADNEVYKIIRDIKERGMLDEAYMQRELDKRLASICHFSEQVAAVTIVSDEKLMYEFGRYWNKADTSPFWVGDNLEQLREMYLAVMDSLEAREVGYYHVSTEPSLREKDPQMRLFHIAVPLLGKNRLPESVREVLVISIKMDDIIAGSSLGGHTVEPAVEGYITDSRSVLLFHENEAWIGQPRAEVGSRRDITELHQKLEYFDWTVSISIDNAALHREVRELFAQGVMVYLLLVVLLFLSWQISLRRILQPINTVKDAMEEIQRGHQEKIHIGGSHEIWQMAQQYNRMIDALTEQQELTEAAYQEKMLYIELRKEAQIKALESQIDAHFLCNTLNAINYNVMESGNDEVAVMLKQLSGILQYAFSTKTETVTLGQEIHLVQQYLSLQKYRLMDKFDYEIRFPEEYGEWPCCKQILQPFAENAIVHGFEGIDTGGRILITGMECDGRFLLEIRDNGCGMSPEVETQLREYFRTNQELKLRSKGNGIGICNVVTRMKHFFGAGFDVQLETKQGEGTCFTFWLPLPAAMEEEEQED